MGRTFDEERSLYNISDATVMNCTFAGPADGESALKECRNVTVDGCTFSLRYPMWNDKKFKLLYSRMDEKTRAALWYSEDGVIEDSVLGGIKAVRGCRNLAISRCAITSPEFGWKSQGIRMNECDVESEYLFLDSKDIAMKEVRMAGKYSFQYVENLLIEDCEFDTKDAFWHSRNVTVRNSVVKGEYLGWYSENLTLENCRISGTQPLCYCKGLRLIGCTMEDCDLAFEYSDVEADINGCIDSVKNPSYGKIVADYIGEVISDNSVYPVDCEIEIRPKQ